MMDLQALRNPEAGRTLRGTLERVVFHNEASGWTVLRLKLQSSADPVTVVGYMPDPQPGTALSVTGTWVSDPRWGRQFKMEVFETLLPDTAEGIRHYLGSGLLKGIGKRMAQRIVNCFGPDTFRILDEEPGRLSEVKGISARKAEEVKAAWTEHRGIRDLIVFLQPHGISTAYAVRIFKQYGTESPAVVRSNPYRLAMDIRGIGFPTADALAMKLGFDPAGDLRAEAGLLHQLNRFSDEGNVFYPLEELLHACADELGMETAVLRKAAGNLRREKRIVVEELEENGESFPAVYLSRFHHYECRTALRLLKILKSPKSTYFEDPDGLLRGVLSMLPLRLAEEQTQAARAVLHGKVLVVTGGPGTGKTTVINAIIRLFEKRDAGILLAAPTGRAAKRMAEATERKAKTVHRLLEYSPRDDAFQRNEDRPLACGLLVVDEASMLDAMLMYHLLKAVPLGATLVLVGDVNQLPSVGPGNVLGDVIASGAVEVVRLTEVFRQAAQSRIIVNAHRINQGEAPEMRGSGPGLSDFYFIRRDDPEEAAQMIVELVAKRIPARFRLHPVEDIQVLTPMHKGSAGVTELNLRLQEALNRQDAWVKRGERRFYLGDKVMQLRNNYDKDVYNGDTGRICLVNPEEKELTVRYDDKNVLYSFDELDEITTAYAVSVHKAQGSEYPAVVMPVLVQHYMLLQRNLLYTGVTRGKRLVILVGSPKALHIAVRNNRTQRRFTWLDKRLAALCAATPGIDG
ncbi:MAG: ATP-dependent RecD-like DNA helicase [Desulfovibrio sp.]|jgi:exodeoxyribonuclease V alpha subunit|nr:ATP-dependent RecD-like DNA helicase [Desulfovibrio sp.]